MRIGLDIDGVLANFNQAYGKLLIEITGRNLLPENFESWTPPSWYWERELGYTREEEDAAWKSIENSQFWYDIQPLNGAPEFIDKLQFTDAELYFITTRSGKNVKHLTEHWINKHVGVWYPTVLISDDKGPVAKGLKLDLFVDDRDKNIWSVRAWSPSTKCLLVDYPYNQKVSNEEATRVTKLEDILTWVD